MKNKTNWNTEGYNDPINGWHLVEVVVSNSPYKTKVFVDEYKNGYWKKTFLDDADMLSTGQINKWAEIEGWIDAEIKPPMNLGVLVFIPAEDNHITSGMYDVSKKWIMLDTYREVEDDAPVTHWMIMPESPETEE